MKDTLITALEAAGKKLLEYFTGPLITRQKESTEAALSLKQILRAKN